MEIISQLEKAPRGVYCGAIGYVAPGGEALFSVAIRTLLLDREKQTLSLGIGSGITSGSDAEDEYRECFAKAEFFFKAAADFCLIESLRLENGNYPLMQRHLQRLASSAVFFGFSLDLARVTEELNRHAADNGGLQKVRLLLAADGTITLTAEPLTDSAAPVLIALSRVPVDSSDTFRYHKTTRRELLDSGRAERPEVDEVIFLNERGELTEGSYHNLLLRIDGGLLTPKIDSGLLAGVMRQELLDRGEAVEATLFPADLQHAEEIWLINSVRGRRKAVLKAEGGDF
jgi:para-aminobenzoate synthetase/4-amino-4-deoxychorismate lyase